MFDESWKTIEPSLKETLYRALEEVQATKAALFLADGERFAIATQYGFRNNQINTHWDINSAVPDALAERRAPFYANGLAADPRLSEMLYDADTSRVLLAPVYWRGKMLGFVDMRDKARQQPFDEADLPRAQAIVEGILGVLARHGKFGLRPEPKESPGDEGEVVRLHEPKPSEAVLPTDIVETAQAILARGALRRTQPKAAITDEQIRTAAMVLPAIVAMPGAVVAVLTPVSGEAGMQMAAASGTVSAEAMDQFQSKIHGWTRKRGAADPVISGTEWSYQPVPGAPIGVERIQSILSAPVSRGSEIVMVLSVAFEMQADGRTRGALERFLDQVDQLTRLSEARTGYDTLRWRVARYLLEPDMKRHEQLVEHSMRVSELAEKLARYAELEERDVQDIRLAALVHDVGMRLLDYQRLYRKEQLTSDELRYLRTHPVVGAALVAESPLGNEIANMVLHHHERPDGSGYPDLLGGESIPVGSRIIAICEAFDAMTAPDSYQPAVSTMAAVGKIRRAGGEQFDADLAEKFVALMQSTSR